MSRNKGEQFSRTYGAANQYYTDANWSRAAENFEAVLDLIEKDDLTRAGASSNRLIVISGIHSKLVDCFRYLKRPGDAVIHAKKAISYDLTMYGKVHNNIAADYLDLGLAYCENGEVENAKESIDRSWEIDTKLAALEPANPLFTWRTIARAGVKADIGYVEEAARDCIGAIPNLEQDLPFSLIVDAYDDSAQIVQDLGEHALAVLWMEKAIVLEKEKNGVNHPRYGRICSNLSMCMKEMGDYTEALDWINKAINVREYWEESSAGRQQFRQSIQDALDSRKTPDSSRKWQHDVFISYNTNDEQLAESLHGLFHIHGFDAWTFKETSDWSRPREYREILEIVRSHLTGSRILLVICSGTSLTSTCVSDEIEMALDQRIPVFAWYPEGVRIRPFRGSEHYTDSMKHFLTVTSYLIKDQVKSFYGLGIRGQTIDDFTLAIIYQILSGYPEHPLLKQYNLEDVRYAVRHPTKLVPLFLNQDDTFLLHWRRLPTG